MNMNEDIEMTDKQAERINLTTRLDELDRMEEQTNDEETLTYIGQRKKELRKRLDNL